MQVPTLQNPVQVPALQGPVQEQPPEGSISHPFPCMYQPPEGPAHQEVVRVHDATATLSLPLTPRFAGRVQVQALAWGTAPDPTDAPADDARLARLLVAGSATRCRCNSSLTSPARWNRSSGRCARLRCTTPSSPFGTPCLRDGGSKWPIGSWPVNIS